MNNNINKGILKYSVAILASLLLILPTTQAADIPDTIEVSGQTLNLNGDGTRKKAFIKLYKAGLYLQAASQDGAAIMNADEPMAIRLVIVSGLIDSENLQEAMEEGFEQSTRGDTSAISAEIESFESVFEEEVTKKDVIDFIYQPTTGTDVIKNGESKVTIAGLPFKQALFGIWLSENPVQSSLKEDMFSQ